MGSARVEGGTMLPCFGVLSESRQFKNLFVQMLGRGANQEQQTKTKDPDESRKDVDMRSMMPKVSQLTDRFGNTFQFGNCGDLWLPAFPIGADNDYRTHVRQIRDLEVRQDDILVCSFPKSGVHWHHEILKMLMCRQAKYFEGDPTGFLDKNPIDSINKLPSPRLLLTHVNFRYIPRQALEKKIKIICLDRNPKDVIVSYYNHMHNGLGPLGYPGTFEHFFYLCFEVGYCYGDIFDYNMGFQEGMEAYPDLDIYTSVFEDMKSDPVSGVKKINAYLGTGCSDELCEEIAIACSFKNLKAYKDANLPASVAKLYKTTGSVFYRKGDVGDWKNWFTVAMNEYFDAEYKKRMADFKTQYKYTL